jgi:TonB family protein
MKCATTSARRHRSGRTWLLAALASGLAAPVGAQAEGDAPGPAATAAAPFGAAQAAAGADETSPDLVPAEPADPVAAGERLVADTVAEYGRRSLLAAEAYLELAGAQREAKDYEKAAENYVAAIDIYRAVDGPFTPLAIAPLTELGDNYAEAKDYVNAVAAYSEARTVSRRAYGLHNEGQIELLDKMSASLLELDQVSEAEEQQLEALRLVQRANPPGSDAVLEGIYKYAEWLGERLLFQSQRDQYARALRIIREHYGEDDVHAVKPLLGIGNTYREERNPASAGLTALEDALALLMKQPERDYVAIATALRDIGDWNVAFGKSGYQGTEYQRAWEMLGNAPDGERLRREWFTGVNVVLYEPFSPRGLSTEPEAITGYVTARFDLDTSGNTSNVAVIESEPKGFKDEAVLRHIRRSRFRPHIEDGELVPAKGLAMRVTFSYLPESLDDDED